MGQSQPRTPVSILFVDITGPDHQGRSPAEQREPDAILGTWNNSWRLAFYSEV